MPLVFVACLPLRVEASVLNAQRFQYVDRYVPNHSLFDSSYTKSRLPFKRVWFLRVPRASKPHTIPQYPPARSARICANPATADDHRTHGLHPPGLAALFRMSPIMPSVRSRGAVVILALVRPFAEGQGGDVSRPNNRSVRPEHLCYAAILSTCSL